MFPSSNTYDSFPLNAHMLPGTFLSGDKHPAAVSSVQEDPPSPPPFWQFSAPFIDGDDDNDGLLMSHLLSQQISSSNNMAPPNSEIKAAPAPPITKETKKVTTKRKRNGSNGAKQGTPRKRVGKKDRHSKIYTAHGPRDRRMRLSLQIARKFFDLQDMLGFDKASKTIEWLFSKSKAAIKELTENLPGMKHMSCSGGGKSMSSTSESEVVSAAKESADNSGEQQVIMARGRKSMRSTATAAGTVVKQERKSRKVWFNPVARESRDKARARARERTREKMKMKELEKSNNCCGESSDPCELERLRSSSPLETGENSVLSTQTNISSVRTKEEEEQPHQNTVLLLENQMDSVSIIEKFLGITKAAPTSSSMFNYSHNIADASTAENYFSGNWVMNHERIHYSYCAMTDMKKPTGNADVQEQNPNINFMTDPNGQHQKYSTSILMSNSNTLGQNPSSPSYLMVNNSSYAKIMNQKYSYLMNSTSSNAHEERSPTSILMDNIALHSHYQENPPCFPSKLYNNFY